MRNLYAIYRKEMRHYFVSPVAYVCSGLFLLISAFFFNFFLSAVIQQSFQMEMQSMQFGMPQQFDVPGQVMRAFLGLLSTLILFITPFLTMGVFAEERKRGTMELLMTSPISEIQVVLGKFLASLSLVVYMYLHSDPIPPWRMLLAGYAGILLLGGSLLALGIFISSLTENQLIAAVLTFVAFLFLWVLDLGHTSEGGLGSVLQYLSASRHYDDFARGIIDTSGLIYYFSFMVLFVFLTVRSIDSMRWRRA
jgi:ABC-2 type transport system permease protein